LHSSFLLFVYESVLEFRVYAEHRVAQVESESAKQAGKGRVG
jgi:hypothetical protein